MFKYFFILKIFFSFLELVAEIVVVALVTFTESEEKEIEQV